MSATSLLLGEWLMLCPACKTELPAGAKFCLSCGAPQPTACPSCGTSLPAGARFCLNCGLALEQPAPAASSPPAASSTPSDLGLERLQRLVPKEFLQRLMAARGKVERERRLVTILFSDIKGSTAMAQNLDPEEVLEIMDGAFDALIAPIYHHEGTLARLMGDAILAFFGAPIAHEDDPERAVRAALEIVANIKEYAAALEQQRGLSGFNVRVGINTGLVVVGEVGSDLRVEYTAMGDAINLASRMEQNAPIGGILITHATYQHLRGLFDVQPQPPLLVKGHAEPVQTYVVQRLRPRTFHAGGRGIEGIETPMVGRHTELEALQAAFQHLVAPPSYADSALACLTLVGDAGVGKSRLLLEFENWLAAQPGGYGLLRGRATPNQQHLPYGVLRDLLSERLNILESDSAAQVRQKFEAGLRPYLEPDGIQLAGHLLGLGFDDAPAVKNLAGSRAQVTQAIIQLQAFFCGLAAHAPQLVFLEDLHWVDDSTLDFFEGLVAKMQEASDAQRLLLIALTRPTLFERRPGWGNPPGWQRLDLLPLSEEHSLQLVDMILARLVDPPEMLRRLIIERAEGNPFYLEELVMMLIGDGVIVCEPPAAGQSERWRVEPERLKDLRVPSTLVGVLQARIDSLSESEKELLQRAAVIGRRFWDLPLEALAAGKVERPLPAELAATNAEVNRLCERQLIFPQPRSAFQSAQEYIFKHAILHDVVYETVLLKLRRLYHRLVAEWLEVNCHDRLDEYAGLIAFHYEQARENEKAFEWLYRAGTAALDFSAFRDALDLLQRALALLPPEASTRRAGLLGKIGFIHSRLGDMKQSSETLQAAVDMAALLEEWALLSKAQNNLGFVAFTMGDVDRSKSLTVASVDSARKAGDPERMAAALMNYADFQETEQAAQAMLEESLDLFRQADLPTGEATCLLNMGNFFHAVHNYDRAQACYEQSLAIYRRLNNRWGIANDLANLGNVLSRIGQPEAAIRLYQEAIQIEREIGDRESLCIALFDLGVIYMRSGQLDIALENLRQGLVEARAAQVARIKQMTLIAMADIACRQGAFRRTAWLLGPVQEMQVIEREVWDSEAQPLFEKLRAALPAAEMEAALAEGAALGVDGVIERVLQAP